MFVGSRWYRGFVLCLGGFDFYVFKMAELLVIFELIAGQGCYLVMCWVLVCVVVGDPNLPGMGDRYRGPSMA